MPGNRLDDVLRFASLEQISYDRVPEIVKPEAG
jgi:hypothetical protein